MNRLADRDSTHDGRKSIGKRAREAKADAWFYCPKCGKLLGKATLGIIYVRHASSELVFPSGGIVYCTCGAGDFLETPRPTAIP